MIQNVLLHMIFGIANQNNNEYQNYIHNLQSSFDSALIEFHSIMVLSVIFESSLIIENVLHIQSYFLILAFQINDIVYYQCSTSLPTGGDSHYLQTQKISVSLPTGRKIITVPT